METLILTEEDFDEEGYYINKVRLDYMAELNIVIDKGIVHQGIIRLARFKKLDVQGYIASPYETVIRVDSRVRADTILTSYGIYVGGDIISNRKIINTEGSIEAGEDIIAYSYIFSAGYIRAGGKIDVDGEVIAGTNIECKKTLSWNRQLSAGVRAWREYGEKDKKIIVGKLVPKNESAIVASGVVEEIGLPDEQHL